MEWLQAHVSGVGLSIFQFLSAFGEEIAMLVILGFVYWSFNKKLGKTMGLSVLSAFTWGVMLKNIFLRRRPYFDHESIQILRKVDPGADIYDINAQGYSFPSGHSTNSASLFGSLALGVKKNWVTVIAILIPLGTGISRFVLGAHYPTDVLVGWLVGIFGIFMIPFLQRKIKNPAILYGLLILTVIPGFFYIKSTDYYTGVGLLIGFILGCVFEEKFVRFEDTRKPLEMILRVVGGFVVYLVLNTALKLPFSKEFLAGGSTAALYVRMGRYLIISFVDFGVYPALFRIGKGKK